MGFTEILEHFRHFLETKNIFTEISKKRKKIEDKKYLLHKNCDFIFKKMAIVCDFELIYQQYSPTPLQ